MTESRVGKRQKIGLNHRYNRGMGILEEDFCLLFVAAVLVEPNIHFYVHWFPYSFSFGLRGIQPPAIPAW